MPTHTTSRSLLAGLGLAACALGWGLGCVFGYRGELEFGNEASLSNVETVQLHLPATELVLAGETERTFIDWTGAWISLGGNGADAIETARKAKLVWESWDEVGRLSARVPLEARDITTLDHLDVDSASYLAHEIVGTGNVFVTGIDAYLSIDLDGGDVQVLGGTDQLRVRTTRGDVELSTAAAVDVRSGAGRVRVEAEAGRDIVVDTVGPVTIAVAETANLAIDIEGAGEIDVSLDDARHLGSGSYGRTLGQGSARLEVRSHGGRVEITALTDASNGGTGETGETGGP